MLPEITLDRKLLWCRSDSYSSRSSVRPSELPKLPNLPATRQKAEDYRDSKATAVIKPAPKKVVAAGTVTKISRAASYSGSSSSSFTSSSSQATSRSSKLPAIATAKGTTSNSKGASKLAAAQSPKSSSKAQSGAAAVKQQQEVMRSNLQQTKAATSQEQARLKNSIQQHLQPGKMLF